ncbi:hypothetical protein ABIE27_002560 [Paenibacillus sp. 4624]|uniref:hypothetical protein n=1 Tax=Paenibacillus sp. 4624 TaxID=3156453 RepID=UPI003D229B33
MRKYRELGEFGLIDQRGRRTEYIDQEQFEIMEKIVGNGDIQKLCHVFHVSRSGLYAHAKRKIISLVQCRKSENAHSEN